MKHVTSLSPLLLAGALFASAAFAQEQAAPPAADTSAEAPAEAAAPAAEAPAAQAPVAEAPVAEAPAADAPATDAPAAEAAPTVTTQVAAPSTLNAQVLAAIGTPKEGKAQVVFFRPSKFTGGAVKFKVREGETELGQLSSGRFFVRNLEPGAHVFTVHSESKDVTNVELEAGETYFLAGSISMGVMVGRPNLAPSDAAAFEAALKKMKKLEIAE